MAQKAAALGLRYFFVDLLGGIAYFPLWWYTRGLKQAALRLGHSARDADQFFGLSVWVKNLFVPMYGETNVSGRIISFFARFVMIVFRGAGVAAWVAVSAVFFVVYLLALPGAVIGILFNLETFMALR